MKKLFFISISFLIVIAGLNCKVQAQEENSENIVAIGFYNLENLFDTINDAGFLLSDEFTPKGPKNWNTKRYYQKQENMAFVISKMATDEAPDGLALVGLAEIENRGVLEDLVNQKSIKDRDYQIVHYDSPDRRGIDVALLYQPRYFRVTESKIYHLRMADDTAFRTRDQLLVAGWLNGDMIYVLVNHWPSRRGGPEASEPKRIAAANLSRHIVDSLLNLDNNAKILIMGDLNDNPTDKSIISHLKAVDDESVMETGELYDPMISMYKNGKGTLEYKDIWDLFDQIIISQAFLSENNDGYRFYEAHVFDKDFLKQKEGKYEGYPDRTYAGNYYLGGYSDHLPVYILLKK